MNNVWVKASERLPNEKGYYISRRPTLSGTSWIVENKPFNPKYDDTYLHNWKNYEIEWLDENTQVESDIDVAFHCQESNRLDAIWFADFCCNGFVKLADNKWECFADEYCEKYGLNMDDTYTTQELYNIYLEQLKSNK